MAASAFHAGHSDVAEIETAYSTLTPLLGAGAAGVFLTALLASGLSSSAVGTMAGQLIMQGFVGFRIPIVVRRLVTMIPAFIVVWLGVNSTSALVISQVVLSFALPAPVIALLMFTRRKDIMGAFVNSRLTNFAAIVGTVVILALNAILLLQTVRRRHSRVAEQLRSGSPPPLADGLVAVYFAAAFAVSAFAARVASAFAGGGATACRRAPDGWDRPRRPPCGASDRSRARRDRA